jgi:glucose-1-phosphate thymidylyltransferase
LPVYDKPMIYYPLSVLMLAGIQDILIISTPSDLPRFVELLGDGSQWGVSFSYAEQPKPEGIAQAFILGRDFVGKENVCLILGDNIFYGSGLYDRLKSACTLLKGSVVFGYWVNDPQRYGVVSFDSSGKPVELAEKPPQPKSNWAVTGLYFYDNSVLDVAQNLKPSRRGELEITDVNKYYLRMETLRVERLGRGFAWLDTGTHETLLAASTFIETIEKRQGLKIACVEEIAYRMGYINAEHVLRIAQPLKNSGYGEYLINMIHQEE